MLDQIKFWTVAVVFFVFLGASIYVISLAPP